MEDYSEFEGPDAVLNRITYAVIGAAMEVHRELGPGHVEAVYERALAVEFRRRGIRFEQQHAYAVKYQGEWVGDGRVDFLVEGLIVVELKAVEKLDAVHTQQVVSYLKALSLKLGLLLNFNTKFLRDGIKRIAN